MKAFSFVHTADLHLGYAQYGLEERRQDFDNAFGEIVDKSIDLKVDFMIIAGDLFHQARPSNVTLENTVKTFKRLKDANIPVLTVDGSHDMAPNSITSTILYPLDSAGLIYHLPRHEGACWRKADCCYVYGVPNFRSRRKTEETLPQFLKQKPPTPDHSVTNIFVFHAAVDLTTVKPQYIEAEIPPNLIPDGFDYYAGGHIHQRFVDKFKTGLLAYSGCTETVSYDEAKYKKGVYHVKVNEEGEVSLEVVELRSPRKFVVLEEEFTGLNAQKITDIVVQMVKSADEEDAIIIPVLKGVLPPETSRTQLDMGHIRNAAEKALLVHPIVLLKESTVSEEIVRSIFESEFKDPKTKAFEYFMQIFSTHYSHSEAEKIARYALSLIEPLTNKKEEKVRQILEELLN
ncbi:MAG: DNA repair exonuclease [Candidatus Bathyarchaeota archaeon]|nr:DNA repair exonuclease [Candidatus Bathyarchaeota archaeon]